MLTPTAQACKQAGAPQMLASRNVLGLECARSRAHSVTEAQTHPLGPAKAKGEIELVGITKVGTEECRAGSARQNNR